MEPIKSIIEIKNLSFNYDKTEILQNISLQIEANKFTVFLGQNGSGKSTLMRIIAGLIPYKNGNILVENNELSNYSIQQRAKIIGFLPQKHKAVFPFSVQDVVLTGRVAYVKNIPQKNDLEIALKSIKKVGIEHLTNRNYTELSGGEQQLVMIARALAQETKILLFDEPISHLDYNNQIKFLNLVKQLVSESYTIVSVLHDPNLAFQFGDKFMYVHNKNVTNIENSKPWEHPLAKEVFHENIHQIMYNEKCVFIPKSL